MDNFLTDYIKAIENPNKVGWNGKVWTAPNLKGYDPNQRGYGIDIRYNDSAKALTKNRKGQWLTDSEATNLMNDHLNYLKGVALRKIKGFDNFSPKKQAIILGMLYRGDSVLSNVDVNEQDDTKFMNSVHNYYISKGLNERAKNSSNFFASKQKRNIVPNFSIPNTNYVLLPDNLRILKPMIFLQGGIFSMLSNSPAKEWGNDWKRRNQSSKVLRLWEGKEKPKRDWKKEEQERIQKQTTPLRTWRSDVADALHGIGEGVLALNPYTAIPYYGAKVGLDFLNGTYGWHTALNASIPLFHLAPQAVGLKEATNIALEDAANLGSKTAKNWRVAREINLATKNKPKYIRVPSKNLFRTQVYKGGEITDPYSNFVTTDPLYAANYGKVTPYIFESKSIVKAKEPMMGYRDPVSLDMFIYNNTKRNPNATAIIGHDAITGEFIPSKGIEILNMNPKNLYPVRISDSPTSLKFFERRPARISEAERLGIPKGERNLPNEFKTKFESREQLGEYLGDGSELTVYDSRNGYVNKVYEEAVLPTKKDLRNFINGYLQRNKVSIQEPVEYVGYFRQPRIGLPSLLVYYPVFRLKKLRPVNLSGKEFETKIRKWLRKNGYNDNVEEGVFTNGKHTLIDILPENTGYHHGDFRFFDVAIEKQGGKIIQQFKNRRK